MRSYVNRKTLYREFMEDVASEMVSKIGFVPEGIFSATINTCGSAFWGNMNPTDAAFQMLCDYGAPDETLRIFAHKV